VPSRSTASCRDCATAITNADELYCWGGNASGQLGVVTQDQCASGTCSREPRRVFPSDP
jgi:alpha-tubulin suppressor-like RCC1 family protein